MFTEVGDGIAEMRTAKAAHDGMVASGFKILVEEDLADRPDAGLSLSSYFLLPPTISLCFSFSAAFELTLTFDLFSSLVLPP